MLTKKEKLEKQKKEIAIRRREKTKLPKGRPTSYSDKIAKHICNERKNKNGT